MTKYGHCWNHICLGSEVNGKESPRITGVLSTQYFECCELGYPGVICHQIMGNEEQSTSDLSGGAEKGGWENLLEILTDAPDYKWLMINAGHIKVHPHGHGVKFCVSEIRQSQVWRRGNRAECGAGSLVHHSSRCPGRYARRLRRECRPERRERLRQGVSQRPGRRT